MEHQKKDDLDAVREIAKVLEGFEPDDIERIIRWVKEKLKISSKPEFTSSLPVVISQPAIGGQPAPQAAAATIREFVEEKKPKNDLQFVTVTAYFYRFVAPTTQRKDTITEKDLMEACRLANHKRPPIARITLSNTVNAGYIDRVSKGEFSINSVGENLVAMLLPTNDSAIGSKFRKKTKMRILIKSAAVLFQFGHYSDEFGHVQKLAALG